MTTQNIPVVNREPIDLSPYKRYADDDGVLGLFEELKVVRRLIREPCLRHYHAHLGDIELTVADALDARLQIWRIDHPHATGPEDLDTYWLSQSSYRGSTPRRSGQP